MDKEFYYVGMSLGHGAANSAYAIVSTKVEREKQGKKYFYQHNCTELHRFPINKPFIEIVEHVTDMFRHIKLKGAVLVLDASSVGAPIAELFSKLDPIWLTFTGSGYGVQEQGSSHYRVPLVDILATLRVAFESHRLKFAPGLEYYDELVTELESMQDDRKAGKAEEVLWRERPHDDLSFSIASVLWASTKDYRIPYIDENGKLSEPGGYEADEKYIQDYDPYHRR